MALILVRIYSLHGYLSFSLGLASVVLFVLWIMKIKPSACRLRAASITHRLWEKDLHQAIASATRQPRTTNILVAGWKLSQMGHVNFVEYDSCNFQIERDSVLFVPSKLRAKYDQPLLDDYCGLLPKKIQFGYLSTELFEWYSWGTILKILASIVILIATYRKRLAIMSAMFLRLIVRDKA